jgi:LAO/AO transport system kinase
MKAGLMEIADVFVVNKADRPEADLFVRNLRLMLAPSFKEERFEIPVIKTTATEKKGMDELWMKLNAHLESHHHNRRKSWLLAEKAWNLIVKKRMQGLSKTKLKDEIEEQLMNPEFNLYRFTDLYS